MTELQKALRISAKQGFILSKGGFTLEFFSSRWVILHESDIEHYFEYLDDAVVKFEEITR